MRLRCSVDMKPLPNLLQITAALFVFAGGPALIAQEWQVVIVKRVSLEGTLKTGAAFEVQIESGKAKAEREYFGATEAPQSAIEEIMVKVGGDKIRFPKQAFEDLSNAALQTVSLTSQPSGEMRLRFTGGEAAAGYEVEYFMQPGRLVKRSLTVFEASGGAAKHQVVKTMTF